MQKSEDIEDKLIKRFRLFFKCELLVWKSLGFNETRRKE